MGYIERPYLKGKKKFKNKWNKKSSGFVIKIFEFEVWRHGSSSRDLLTKHRVLSSNPSTAK
jgi:hypothetical protein